MCEEQRKLQQMYEGKTWEQVGEALGVSGALARKVALGECRPGLKVRKALGTHRRRYRLALEFETKEEQKRFVRRLAIYGNDRKEQTLRLSYKI